MSEPPAVAGGPIASLADFQIVESYFTSVTGIEPDAAVLVIRFIDDRGYELAVDVEIHLGIANAHFELVGTGAGANRAARRPVDDLRFNAGFMQDDFVFGSVAVGNKERVILETAGFLFAVNHQSVALGRIPINAAGPYSHGGILVVIVLPVRPVHDDVAAFGGVHVILLVFVLDVAILRWTSTPLLFRKVVSVGSQ